MEKEMLAIAKLKSGEGKFEKFMGFMQSDEGMAVRKTIAHVEKTVPAIAPDKSYIMFVRPGGVEGTWAFFNLVFVQNLSIFIVNTYSIKIDKTGVKNDSNEGVIAPLVFTILSAVLIYGLSDKIYS